MQRQSRAVGLSTGLIAFLASVLSCAEAAANACEDAVARAVIDPDAGAVRLRLEGHVFEADGETPAAGVLVYVHHTGSNGLYDSAEDGAPRRQAFLRTDAEGRFVLDSAMPAAYPDRTQPAHIHLDFWGEGVPHQWSDDVLFADDPLVSAEVRAQSLQAGKFAWVSEAPLEEGVRVVRRAIRLKAKGDRFDPHMRFGLTTCGAE